MRDDTLNEDLAVEERDFQTVQQSGKTGGIHPEVPFDGSFILARSDELTRSSGTEQQRQRIDDEAFASPRSAGEDGKAVFEGNIDVFQDGEVGYHEPCQHGYIIRACIGFPPSNCTVKLMP